MFLSLSLFFSLPLSHLSFGCSFVQLARSFSSRKPREKKSPSLSSSPLLSFSFRVMFPCYRPIGLNMLVFSLNLNIMMIIIIIIIKKCIIFIVAKIRSTPLPFGYWMSGPFKAILDKARGRNPAPSTRRNWTTTTMNPAAPFLGSNFEYRKKLSNFFDSLNSFAHLPFSPHCLLSLEGSSYASKPSTSINYYIHLSIKRWLMVIWIIWNEEHFSPFLLEFESNFQLDVQILA